MINSLEIKAFMARKGMESVKELAEKVGVSSSTLGRWLDKNDMPTSAAEKIIKILEIPKESQTSIFFAVDVACHATMEKQQITSVS